MEYISNKYSQDEILQGIRENHPKVIKWLYCSEYPKIEKYILSNKGTEEHAKDIMQESMMVIWKNIKSGKFTIQNGTAVQGYLYRIAKNKWLDHLRASKQNMIPLDEQIGNQEEEEFDDKERKLQVLESLYRSLGDTCREILKRFYFRKQNMSTIAAHFEWTEATARNNKYRCIQQLKGKLKLTKEI